ncbi:MAG: YidC/Oxa1 family insertase periplasmic-domain containing protein, partial [Chloroflexota bacterium]
MDRNTITGLALIFAIFIGFSLYNNHRLNKAYENVVAEADMSYAKGELETARTAYYEALRLKPNQPAIVSKLNEINQKLGISADTISADSSRLSVPLKQDLNPVTEKTPEPGQLGVFSAAAQGQDDYVTLENSKVELKIALKGGKVYSARLKDYKTWDGKPLILFSGDSTVFGFNFFTTDNKAIQTNNLYFTPVTQEQTVTVGSEPKTLQLRLNATDNGYIEYNYTLEPDRYMVEFDVLFKGLEGVIASNQNSITLDWRMFIP